MAVVELGRSLCFQALMGSTNPSITSTGLLIVAALFLWFFWTRAPKKNYTIVSRPTKILSSLLILALAIFGGVVDAFDLTTIRTVMFCLLLVIVLVLIWTCEESKPDDD